MNARCLLRSWGMCAPALIPNTPPPHSGHTMIHPRAPACTPTPGPTPTTTPCAWHRWAELDNCIYSELVTLYQRGQRPSQEELQRIAAEFRAGEQVHEYY